MAFVLADPGDAEQRRRDHLQREVLGRQVRVSSRHIAGCHGQARAQEPSGENFYLPMQRPAVYTS